MAFGLRPEAVQRRLAEARAKYKAVKRICETLHCGKRRRTNHASCRFCDDCCKRRQEVAVARCVARQRAARLRRELLKG